MLNIVLFGPPGAGKGTQSKKIAEKYNIEHISTGEVLRDAIKEKTPLGIEAAKFIDHGNYVSDEIAIQIIQEKMKTRNQSNGFIFDGFPRTTFQARKLDEILLNKKDTVDVMLSIEVKEEELISRLLYRYGESGRADDESVEVIKKRIRIYVEKTEHVKNYYQSIGKYEAIDGNGNIDQIFNNICKVIERYKENGK